MKPGIYYEIPFEEYLRIPAASKSGLICFDKSPAHYYWDNIREDRDATEKSLALRLGTGIHTAILEMAKFYDRYVVIPEDAPKRPTKAQIEAAKPSAKTLSQIAFWETFDSHAAGREQITTEQHDQIMQIARCVRTHPATGALLESGSPEVTLIWEDPIYSVLCKARLDWFSPGQAVIDFKSCEDASPRAFGRDAWNYSYHVQQAFYLDGVEALTGEVLPFFFQAIEKKGPWGTAIYQGTQGHYDIGRMTYRRQIKQYAEALAAQKWPSYSEEITDLWMPDWALKEGKRERESSTDLAF